MRATRLTIRNILGIQEFDIKLGTFNKIEGGNGKGKSSVIEAVKSVIEGGQDASLLHNGATEGEVVLLLDGGEAGDVAKIRESVNANRVVKRDVFNEKGTKLTSPKTRIDELFDLTSTNPIRFLSADRNERGRILLETLPLTVPVEDIERLSGRSWPESMTTGHALVVLDQVHKALFDERTAQTVLKDQAKAAAKKMRDALPPAPEQDYGALLEAEQAKLTALDVEQGKFREHVGSLLEQEKREQAEKLSSSLQASAAATAQHDAEILKLERQIAELRSQIAEQEKHKAAIAAEERQYRAEHDRDVQEAIGLANASFGERETGWEVKRAEIRAEMARLQEVVNQHSKAENLRELIRENEQNEKEAKERHDRLSEKLNGLDLYRRGLLDKLPIPGLSIREGQIYIDDIPFDRLNKARQVQLALQVAKRRAGKLGLILIDNAECLDPETFQAFEEAALAMESEGLQFIVTRVTEGEMKVTAA